MTLAAHSPANVAVALQGIHFPKSKQELVEYAKQNNADPEVLKIMEGMPDEQYTSMADVFKGVGMANE